MESAAAYILQRAVEKDKSEQYTMAKALYEEGAAILLQSAKDQKDKRTKNHYLAKASEYIDRAERIKALIQEQKLSGTYKESTKIESGAVGYGYNSVFGRFLDAAVTQIKVEDPYIRAFHQCQNFLRFCELAVQKCRSLSKITLITTSDPDKFNQMARLDELKKSLASHLVTLEVSYSDTLHDRQIILSTGWVIKIGRGLDYFRPPEGKMVLGYSDLELRPCLETTVDIYHKPNAES
ncbi:MIT domain-containing protein 1-like [Trichogramma pretiosum]|uniref:MIT domain-containing protein n=1 Tax=Trichogramma kaykai TaxID=54128 RepID=A0ABD2XN77_9HYME|nr:MIT domain-containing protein 1-like [Trichogramma pretiosum]